ncbi:MAG TPA: GNAT family N-acetyltransferase [Propionibacteriaceae bacterium]|nr:GNAT family N-acetyltransferase [Propionibacteriaceae bacterium]
MDALNRITPPARLGDRLVIRHRLPGGSATDTIGWLEDETAERLTLSELSGAAVQIDRPVILAARRLPAARGGRDPLRTSAAQLERVAVEGWFAERQPLGEWTLRSGGGFTGRANSCLAVGDPGVPVKEAAERIVEFAEQRGSRPWAQVISDSAEEGALRGLGWTEVYVETDVLVTRLAGLLDGTEPDPRVLVTERLEPDWERSYATSRPTDADPAIVRRILDNGPPRAYAGAAGSNQLIAIGRGHVSADWLGVAAVWTEPGHRRQGWAARVLIGLGHWAARRGARWVYLQVTTENEGAHRAYQRLGFRRHHAYRYLAAPRR